MLAAALVFAAVMAIMEWRRANSVSGDAAVRNRIAATAASEGAALYTYDYRDLALSQKRILALASGGFAQQEEAHATAVEANLANLKATGTATVHQVSVTGEVQGRAGAFVVVDTRAQATGGSTTATQYLNMSLTLQGDQWKIYAVQVLLPPPP